MTSNDWLCLILLPLILTILAFPLGEYMARVFAGTQTFLTPVMAPVERLLYRLFGVDEKEDMSWKTYALSLVVFNIIGVAAVAAERNIPPAAVKKIIQQNTEQPLLGIWGKERINVLQLNPALDGIKIGR